MSGERSGALTREQARARFDAALDGELGAEERSELDALLAADPELAAEYDRQRELLRATKELAVAVPSVDLLASVQHKLRARSGGRFYRDRFAERRGTTGNVVVVLAVSACFVLAVLCWFAFAAGWFGSAPSP